MKLFNALADIFIRIFTPKTVHKIEKVLVIFSLIGFLTHLFLIFLFNNGYLNYPVFQDFSGNYITAIYTPFSFLLLYEVFLFLIYLPKSFTKSIGKQYEIISLIVLRRVFKDISHFNFQDISQNIEANSMLLINMAGVLLLFLLIAIFYHLKKRQTVAESCSNIQEFINIKRTISLILIPVLIGIALYSFGDWFWTVYNFEEGSEKAIPNINSVFYDTFFSILIYVDVFLLNISFIYTQYYSQLVRNSGFVISTILIKLSFTASYFTNISLILSSVIFGVLILLIYNFFIKADEQLDDILKDDKLAK